MAKLSITSLLFIFFFLLPETSFPQEFENVCIKCHMELEGVLQEPVKQWSASVHKKAGISCEDCHGGDPTSYDMAMEPESGYKGSPDKKDIPALCGSCHSDIERMRKFNIRTDQLAAYKTSIHGIRLLKKEDENVASCVDCHGSHNIFSKNDPRSPVYRFNVPQTCARCHENKELMKQYSIPHNQFELYKNSVHGKRLYEEQNLRVPTCPDCHGIHGAVPPGVKDVSFVCSNCHGIISEYYRKSPHSIFNGSKEKPTCVNCHNNHDIQKPTFEKFSGHSKSDCGGCHKDESEAFKIGLAIKERIISAKNSVAEVKDLLIQLKNTRGSGFETSEIENEIDKTYTKMIEAIPATHSLSLKKITEKLDQIVKTSENIKAGLSSKFDDLHSRRIWLAGSWAIILLVVYLLRKLRKSMSH